MSRRAARRRAARATINLGEVLARAFQTYGRNFAPFVMFALLLNAPFIAYRVAHVHSLWDADYDADFFSPTMWLLVWIAGVLAGLVLQCVVSYGTYAQLSGRQGSLSTSMQGLKRFFPVLGIAFLIVVMAYGAVFISTVIGAVGGPISLLLFGIGGLAFGSAIFCAYFVSIQAAIVERGGVARSMARSAWLTGGSRWKVFVLVLLLYLVPVLFSLLVVSRNVGALTSLSGQRNWVLVGGLIGVLFSVAQAVVPAVLYYDLRRAKEGVELSEILEVFD